MVEVQTRLVRHRLFLSKLSLSQVSNSDFLEVVERRKRMTNPTFVPLVFVLCTTAHFIDHATAGVVAGPQERRLINDLMANYNKLERPVGCKLLVSLPTCGDHHLRVIEQKCEL